MTPTILTSLVFVGAGESDYLRRILGELPQKVREKGCGESLERLDGAGAYGCHVSAAGPYSLLARARHRSASHTALRDLDTWRTMARHLDRRAQEIPAPCHAAGA